MSEGFNMPWDVLDRGRICRQDFHSARDAKILPGSASELSYSSDNKVSIILLHWLCNDISLQRGPAGASLASRQAGPGQSVLERGVLPKRLAALQFFRLILDGHDA